MTDATQSTTNDDFFAPGDQVQFDHECHFEGKKIVQDRVIDIDQLTPEKKAFVKDMVNAKFAHKLPPKATPAPAPTPVTNASVTGDQSEHDDSTV